MTIFQTSQAYQSNIASNTKYTFDHLIKKHTGFQIASNCPIALSSTRSTLLRQFILNKSSISMSAPNKLNINYLLNDEMEDHRSFQDPLEAEYADDPSSRRSRRPESAMSGTASMSSLSKQEFRYRGNPNQHFPSHERSAILASPSRRAYPDIATSSRDLLTKPTELIDTKSTKRRNLTRDYKCELCNKSFFERGMLAHSVNN